MLKVKKWFNRCIAAIILLIKVSHTLLIAVLKLSKEHLGEFFTFTLKLSNMRRWQVFQAYSRNCKKYILTGIYEMLKIKKKMIAIGEMSNAALTVVLKLSKKHFDGSLTIIIKLSNMNSYRFLKPIIEIAKIQLDMFLLDAKNLKKMV